MPRASSRYSSAATPQRSVPLNDDRQEKAQRRDARNQAQRDSMRTSGTPGRKRMSIAPQDSPHTPAIDQDVDMPDVTGTAVTPMKRAPPLLANFEEWIKLATDNKINANNSWNFQLIDYFHDMSLLKEGDSVNFQKASCTLEGCVKIYTSRVDSVTTDTGKLLSGLAESGNKNRRGAGAEGEGDEDEDGEEGEDGQKKKKKRAARSAESTLAATFEQLQNKKMDLDLSVDPLFKKATADFDEGGAKGLLLNHLAIDKDGRIVFDSSDDVKDATHPSRETPAPEAAEDQQEELDEPSEDVEIDISGLAAKYFPDLARLDEQDVCPSMKTFDLGDANGSMDLPFLKAPEDDHQKQQSEDDGDRSAALLDQETAPNFDDDDDIVFDMPPEAGFGEGGEIWAREAARDPQARVHTLETGDADEEVGEGGDDGLNAADRPYNLSMDHQSGKEQENILSYFDEALKKNWAGPEHWRIRRVKDIGKAPTTTKRKEKEPFKIDFFSPMSQELANALYSQAPSMASVMLPKSQWVSKNRNLAPDDKHFNSRQLLGLFLKPNVRLGSRRANRNSYNDRPSETPSGDVDAAHWAAMENGRETAHGDEEVQGDYDANFFQDDDPLGMPGLPDDEGETFADARDHFSPQPQNNLAPTQPIVGDAEANEGAFGTQLVAQSRSFRPEYVQYARAPKKVDVKRLKDELWKGIGFEGIDAPPRDDAIDSTSSKTVDGSLKFTQVMNGLQSVYPQKAMSDISTSYCFICLLHLANEKGLVINNEENLVDLSIRRDFTADLSVGD
ncbi:hypothetical protein N0V90_003156 [Kalmusia sp. IMI 367209]|nr:hypothetical protein N0V90_003156 [Kalmusia sp. IMI 367209]